MPRRSCAREAVMEYEALIGGGAGAGAVWIILRVIGRWAARHRWKTVTSTESVEAIAAERAALKIRVHELELRTAAAEAVAKQYRAHIDRHLGVDDGKERIHGE